MNKKSEIYGTEVLRLRLRALSQAGRVAPKLSTRMPA